ncbi:MAG: Rieske 2Fe-2S domain-containing protein [Deltaproteobacteria bacterium]|nr:Rieske 2Fe-2S domain-containing protein [Deltaproteobacteria bacterium]MBV8452662.1 Rieske 2Fe-2S domain-containing protein [Deltaproteobacteria bacterium]
MAQFIKAARRGDIPEGSGKIIEAGGRTLALFHSNGQFYAIDNACMHRGGPLGEGEVYGTRVVCPWHGWEYDFSTGCNVDDPSMKLACFAIKVEGEDILVEI